MLAITLRGPPQEIDVFVYLKNSKNMLPKNLHWRVSKPWSSEKPQDCLRFKEEEEEASRVNAISRIPNYKKEATNGNWPLRPIDHTHRFPTKKADSALGFYFFAPSEIGISFCEEGGIKSLSIWKGVKVAASLSIFQRHCQKE